MWITSKIVVKSSSEFNRIQLEIPTMLMGRTKIRGHRLTHYTEVIHSNLYLNKSDIWTLPFVSRDREIMMQTPRAHNYRGVRTQAVRPRVGETTVAPIRTRATPLGQVNFGKADSKGAGVAEIIVQAICSVSCI